jgi:hypothetical protein
MFDTPEQLKQILAKYPSLNITLIATPQTLCQFSAKCKLSLSLDVAQAQTELYELFNRALATRPNIIFVEKPNANQDKWRAICQQINKYSKPILQFTSS